jgi:hypothetical protein
MILMKMALLLKKLIGYYKAFQIILSLLIGDKINNKIDSFINEKNIHNVKEHGWDA